MNLLILTRYDRLGASSRLRMMQYLPALAAVGITARVECFFDDAYLERLYSGEPGWRRVPSYYMKRIRALRRSAQADVVWLEKEAMPWLPAWLEQSLLSRNVPLVSDYDDAVFHRYDLHGNPLVRRVIGCKIDHVMARSALVMAGNYYLANRAKAAGAARTEIVPTVVDADAYRTDRLPAHDGMLRIGWIGTPGTWLQYMAPMRLMLAELLQAQSARLRVVGAGIPDAPRIESLTWSEAEESRMIQGMDIGLMPLDDSPWSRGKCGYKIIQYMACGVPVVASPTGVNAQIVEEGVTGFLATTEAEWRDAIARLLADPDLRARMGAAGRKRMEERYSLQVWGPKVAQMLRSVMRA